MNLGELKAAVDDAISSGGETLPVIMKYDEADTAGTSVTYNAETATKQGASFRIYVDPTTRREWS